MQSYRIKKRYYNKDCTRFYVQVRFLGLFWYTPEYLGRVLNSSDTLAEAMEVIQDYEYSKLDSKLNNLKNKLFNQNAEYIEV